LAGSDEIRVYFGVFNFEGSPESVTEVAGFEPTQQWVKGESYGSKGGIRTHSRWELASPASSASPFEVQLTALLDFLEQRAESVRAVTSRFEAGVQVAANIHATFNPGFHAATRDVQRLADLKLSLDLDIYFLGESTS